MRLRLMHAIQIVDDAEHGLAWKKVPTPVAAAGQVLVRVRAAGLNRLDLLQRIGRYPVPAGESTILGVEAAGEIDQLGEGVAGWAVGDRVCCLLAGGGYATHALSPASLLLRMPDGMSFEDAAAIPEVYYTAFVSLFLEAGLSEGETVLVHAGASGVGTAAIGLCRALGEHRVFATASGGKLDVLRSLGATEAFDRQKDDFVARVAAATGGRGVDVILDPVAGDYLPRNLACLAPRGRLVVIGLMGGTSAELPLALLLMKRLRVIGSVLRSRSVEEKSEITGAFRERVWSLFERGELRPVVHATYPVERAADAHDLMRSGASIGKIVLTVGDDHGR